MAEDMGQDAVRAVLERLDELVELVRRVDARLEQQAARPARREPFADDPDVPRPRRLVLADPLTEGPLTEGAGRAGPT